MLALILLIAGVAFCLLPGPGGSDDAPSDLVRDASSGKVPAMREAPTVREAAPGDATLTGRSAREEDDRTPRGVRVVVRSKAGIRVPGAGVVASWPGENDTPHAVEEETAADGSVFLPDVPLDGSARVRVRASAQDEPATATDELQVTAPELVVTIDRGLPLHVRCVDDLTGRELRDAVVGGVMPRPTSDEGLPDGDGWVLALVGPNRKDTVRFRVDAPPGFVAWDRTRVLTSVGAWTRELEIVYPLRHEVDVRVSVLDHEGVPESRADIGAFHIAGKRSSARGTERLGPGAFRLRGVPFFRTAVLTVSVVTSTPDHESGIRKSVRLGAHPSDRVELQVTLPPPGAAQATNNCTIGLGPGGAGGAFGGRRRRSPSGDALLEVLRHDGSPASNVRVQVGGQTVRTDAEGLVRVVNLPVRSHRVVVHAIGLLPLEGTLHVEAGRVVELTLREPGGGALDVHVTDAEGEPLPFATIHLRTPSRGAWVDEQGGRQRVDPFTDHLGFRRLERVEAGVVEVRADWGGRQVRTKVVVRESRVTPVALVLP